MSRRADLEAYLPLAPRDLEILLALDRGPRHGYGIIQDVRERTGGRISLATSTLYTALRKLVADGLVSDEPEVRGADTSEGPPRRYHVITPKGRTVLRLEAKRVAVLADAFRARGLTPST